MSICCCGRCLCALIFFGVGALYIVFWCCCFACISGMCGLYYFCTLLEIFKIFVEIETLWLGVPAVQFFCCFETPLDFMDVGLGIVHMES